MATVDDEALDAVARSIWEARRQWSKAQWNIDLEEWGDGSLPKMNGVKAEALAAINAIARQHGVG